MTQSRKIISALGVVGLVLLWLLRYDYYTEATSAGPVLWRVDRVTGTVCWRSVVHKAWQDC